MFLLVSGLIITLTTVVNCESRCADNKPTASQTTRHNHTVCSVVIASAFRQPDARSRSSAISAGLAHQWSAGETAGPNARRPRTPLASYNSMVAQLGSLLCGVTLSRKEVAMKRLMLVPSVLVIGLIGLLAASAHADECYKLTYFTFSAPVELPGVSLPAGTYRFTHPDCGMIGGLLRVSSQDGTEVYGTFLTIPEERMTPTGRPEVVFAEMPAGAPEAVKAWFYPGERTGDGFVYPKSESAKVAAAPVRTIFATNGLA
jgi:hypothetical protein